jgi:hypothetical protein
MHWEQWLFLFLFFSSIRDLKYLSRAWWHQSCFLAVTEVVDFQLYTEYFDCFQMMASWLKCCSCETSSQSLPMRQPKIFYDALAYSSVYLGTVCNFLDFYTRHSLYCPCEVLSLRFFSLSQLDPTFLDLNQRRSLQTLCLFHIDLHLGHLRYETCVIST